MEAAIALFTLAAMEIVLGIDNLVFIAILTARLPKAQQPLARKLGLGLALGMRIVLLLSISYVMSMTQPLFHVSPMLDAVGIPSGWIKDDGHATDDHAERAEHDEGAKVSHESADAISVKDIILIAGGLFLLGKSVLEIHHKVDGPAEHHTAKPVASFTAVLIQVTLFDILFSLDSVITAVGMAKEIWIMITAVIIAIGVMIVFANPVGHFVEKHPTITVLALSFLILIGVLLVAEGLGQHLNKGYIYFAMAFSLIVEVINMRVRSNAHKKAAPPTALT